jgi:hypothetical protein
MSAERTANAMTLYWHGALSSKRTMHEVRGVEGFAPNRGEVSAPIVSGFHQILSRKSAPGSCPRRADDRFGSRRAPAMTVVDATVPARHIGQRERTPEGRSSAPWPEKRVVSPSEGRTNA